MNGTDKHSGSAAPAATGYLYQCQYALWHLIRMGRQGRCGGIRLETRDDVEFEAEGTPLELLQTKHRKAGRRLTNRSLDLWKSVRNWSSLVSDGAMNPPQTDLILVATESVPGPKHAAWHLVPPSHATFIGAPIANKVERARDHGRAYELLSAEATAIIQSGAQEALVPGAEAFLSLTEGKRRRIVQSIVIVEAVPDIVRLNQMLLAELAGGVVRRERYQTLLDLVLGWWYRRIIEALAAEDGAWILFVELENHVAECVRVLAAESLPLYNDAPAEGVLAEFEGWNFIKQLAAINLAKGAAATAKVNFYRAEGHLARWQRETLLDPTVIRRYRDDLHDLWAEEFELGIADDCSDPCRVGRQIYGTVMRRPVAALQGFQGNFLVPGLFQIMANDLSLGWHPDWQALFLSSSGRGGAS